MRLRDKTVIITGAGSGLGRECSLLFARNGANVVVTDIVEERITRVTDLIKHSGGNAIGVTADVRNEADMDAAVASAIDCYGKLDVMFANAGAPPAGFGKVPFDECTLEDWNDINAVILGGVFLAAKSAVRQFKKQGSGGNIIATGSAGGIAAYPGFYSYGAAKAGVHHLVKCLAFDLGKFGIRANALAPTHGMSVNFAMPPDSEATGLSYEEAAAAESGWKPDISPIPLKLNRPPSLSDNAMLALFLASDESAYMSGVVIPATDGGTLSRVSIGFDDGWSEQLAPQQRAAKGVTD